MLTLTILPCLTISWSISLMIVVLERSWGLYTKTYDFGSFTSASRFVQKEQQELSSTHLETCFCEGPLYDLVTRRALLP